MRKGAILLVLFVGLSGMFSRSFAQSDSLNGSGPPKLLLGFSIAHTAFHGIKLEALFPIAPKFYLNISPEFYSGKLAYADDGKLSGLGLHSGLRYAYWIHERKGDGVMAFVQSDLEYNYFRIDKRDKYWVEREQNGQNVLLLEEGDVFKKYHRMGINYRMGGLWHFQSGFYYEWSFGVALRHAYTRFSSNYFPDYKNDDYPWSYGYSGVTPLIGLRFGFLIR